MNQSEPVMRVLHAYKAAVYAKNVDAFTALYAQDVRIFDAWGAWSCNGLGMWRPIVTDWFSGLGSERVVVDMDEVRTIAANDVAVIHAFVSYTAVSAEGRTLRAMQNRLTWGLTHTDGAWKIAHEHTSAPIDFSTTKAILQR